MGHAYSRTHTHEVLSQALLILTHTHSHVVSFLTLLERGAAEQRRRERKVRDGDAERMVPLGNARQVLYQPVLLYLQKK